MYSKNHKLINAREGKIPVRTLSALALVCSAATVTPAGDFAAAVIEYRPAPGQFINDPQFNDPAMALGAPVGGGEAQADNSKVVSLGAFGGSITLAFSETVTDDPDNPLGLDAIVFGNAYYVAGNPNRRWAEPGIIEISRDVNGNGLADDPWYLVPGTHVTDPWGQFAVQAWDDDEFSPLPPENIAWYPQASRYPWAGHLYSTQGYVLPENIFNETVVENPEGDDAEVEGYFGYADCSPVLALPPDTEPDEFYTVPDDPFSVGISEGSGGGDAFDIAWAIDPVTGQPAGLDGFDFIRISTGTSYDPDPLFGEKSTEISAVADVRPDRRDGDINGDGIVDQADLGILLAAYDTVPGDEFWNEDADINNDGTVGQIDLGILLAEFGL